MVVEEDIPQLSTDQHFGHWKKRFEVYVKTKGRRLWRIIEFGDYIPETEDQEAGGMIVKPESEWSEEDEKKVGENYLAKHLLYCAISSKSDFWAIYWCETAHDIWITLDKHRSNDIVEYFKTFQMGKNESIDDMYLRFNTTLGSLRRVGRYYSMKKKVERFLDALPDSDDWNDKVNDIREMKNFSHVSLEDVIEDLKVYEAYLQNKQKQKQCRFNWTGSTGYFKI